MVSGKFVTIEGEQHSKIFYTSMYYYHYDAKIFQVLVSSVNTEKLSGT